VRLLTGSVGGSTARRLLLLPLLAVIPLLVALTSGHPTGAVATPTAPFTECPAVGYNTSCSLLIDVTDSGDDVLQDTGATMATDPTPGTYDGADDTLIGILNNSSIPLSQITLSSTSADIFDFSDGDGICENPNNTSQLAGLPASDCADVNTKDTTTYGGPDSYFTNDSSLSSGTVNFITPIAPGASTYFSLESALTLTTITTLTNTTTSLSGGGQSGTSISVPPNTAVTDAATLTGSNAASATGTVTYDVYSDAGCTTLAPGGGGSAETITTPGTLPTSSAVTLPSAGTYYWQAVYSGDTSNGPSVSTCGSAGEVETVTTPVMPQPTSLTTSLSGGGQSGTSIAVPPDTAVTDAATLTGTDAATATGTVTYNVYSDPSCSTSVSAGTAETIATPGTLPPSSPVALAAPGTYYWQALYSGDLNNSTATSACGLETETVKSAAAAAPTRLTTSLYGHGTYSGTRCEWLGSQVTVLAGAQVTDSAFLWGANAATAGGSVTFTVYKLKSPHSAPVQVASGGTVTVTNGVVPASTPVTINAPGTYFWQASYSGDALDAPSLSPIGSEIERVIAVPQCRHGWDVDGNGQCWRHRSWGH